MDFQTTPSTSTSTRSYVEQVEFEVSTAKPKEPGTLEADQWKLGCYQLSP